MVRIKQIRNLKQDGEDMVVGVMVLAIVVVLVGNNFRIMQSVSVWKDEK